MPAPQGGSSAGSPQDRAIAMDMLKDSKFCVASLAKAAAEASNAQFRQFLGQALHEAIDEHFRLTDLMIGNGWQDPQNIEQQLQSDLALAEKLGQQAAASAWT